MTEKRRGYEAKIFLLISAAFSAYGVYFAGEYGFALSFLFFSFSFLFFFFGPEVFPHRFSLDNRFNGNFNLHN